MKKLHSLIACTLVACASLFVLSSCEGDAGGLAPKSVTGKTFKGGWEFGVITFTSSSEWVWKAGDTYTDIYNESYTPKSYSYKKTSAETAELTIICSRKRDNSDYVRTRFLNFTTPETGWYVEDRVVEFTLR